MSQLESLIRLKISTDSRNGIKHHNNINHTIGYPLLPVWITVVKPRLPSLVTMSVDSASSSLNWLLICINATEDVEVRVSSLATRVENYKSALFNSFLFLENGNWDKTSRIFHLWHGPNTVDVFLLLTLTVKAFVFHKNKIFHSCNNGAVSRINEMSQQTDSYDNIK